MHFTTATSLALLASLVGLGVVHGADSKSADTAASVERPPAVVADANIATALSAAISATNFPSDFPSNGNLTIFIAGIPARATVTASCSRHSNAGIICNAATTLQMASDGTLNDEQGVSILLTQIDDNKAVVMAMLSFN
jgi:hypothetical protein